MAIIPLFDDLLLLQKIAEGDRNAFRMLYDRYSKKVYLFALRILNSEEEAEEVMQEIMLKIWQMKDRAQIGNLEAYLKVASRNYCYNILRREKRHAKADSELKKDWVESHNETEERILLNETQRILSDAVDMLPPQQKLVYQLCHQEGLKYEEAAQRLNLSTFTVQSYMKLALRFLRNHVNKHTGNAALLVIFKLLS